MQKKTEKIIAACAAVLLILSLGLFAGMPQTSAWFYQKNENEKNFVFGTFDVEQEVEGDLTVSLKAAAKIEDRNSIFLSLGEDGGVVHVESISTENKGTVPARVYLTFSGDDLEGLQCILYDENETEQDIRAAIFAAAGVEDTDTEEQIKTRLADYQNEGYIYMLPGESRNLKLAIWADYNALGDDFKAINNNAQTYEDLKSLSYDITITMTAIQDTDEAFEAIF